MGAQALAPEQLSDHLKNKLIELKDQQVVIISE